jgi:hypothetical protein
MSRPRPQILAETQAGLTHLTVAASSGCYMVAYQGRPFTLIQTRDNLLYGSRAKYPKTVFTNPGHAHNLARKLNHWFNSSDFTVIEVA